MFYKSILQAIHTSFLLICVSAPLTCNAMRSGTQAVPAQPQAGMPQKNIFEMSPEELQKWEKQLDGEIQSFVKTLPPDQQAQFHKDVEELTKVMENMSEDELIDFVGGVLSEGEMPAAPQKPTEKPKPAPKKVVKKKKEEPKKPRISSKEKQARALIESIIYQIRKLLQKVQGDPALPGKIEEWGNTREIEHWNKGLSWEAFKNELEKFEQKLNKLIDQDPKTLAYRYLPYLTSNAYESLYNNLSRISALLNREVPDIIVPEFGLKKMSKESKRAMKKSLSTLTEAVYKTNVPKKLDDLIKKYDPTAKKLREAEEKTKEQAVTASKKRTIPRRTRVVGQADTPSYGRTPSYDTGGRGAYGPGYRQPSPHAQRGRRAATRRPGVRGAGRTPAAKSTARASAPGKKDAKQEIDDKKIKPNGGISVAPTKKEEKEDRLTQRYVNQFADSLEKAENIIEANKNLTTLQQLKTIDKDTSTAARQVIQSLEAAHDGIGQYSRRANRNLNATQQDYYKKEFKKVFKEYDKKLSDIARDIKLARRNKSKSVDANVAKLEETIRMLTDSVNNIGKTFKKRDRTTTTDNGAPQEEAPTKAATTPSGTATQTAQARTTPAPARMIPKPQYEMILNNFGRNLREIARRPAEEHSEFMNAAVGNIEQFDQHKQGLTTEQKRHYTTRLQEVFGQNREQLQAVEGFQNLREQVRSLHREAWNL